MKGNILIIVPYFFQHLLKKKSFICSRVIAPNKKKVKMRDPFLSTWFPIRIKCSTLASPLVHQFYF